MPKPRLTGVSAWGFSLSAEYVETNKDIVWRVLSRLEDRRVLWRSAHSGQYAEHEMEQCRISANMIRDLLSTEIDNVGGGEVAETFKRIRTAARNFDSEAGTEASRFKDNPEHFKRALVTLRLTVGREILALAQAFEIDLAPYVIDSLPPQDLSWLPGFGDGTADSGP